MLMIEIESNSKQKEEKKYNQCCQSIATQTSTLFSHSIVKTAQTNNSQKMHVYVIFEWKKRWTLKNEALQLQFISVSWSYYS